jgi:FK506-binding protein 1|tara:strand:- start:66 stop:533 length:468 start_codon:yes stop_codon:yes gene_type:complete
MALAKAQRQKKEEEKRKKELALTITKPGDAVYFPKQFDSISMHYIGYLADGSMFDNSYQRGQPVNFILGGGHVIEGWERILPMLSKGEKARITVPPHLAYGDRGYPPVIPPLATLTYEIELLTFTSSTHQNIGETMVKNTLEESNGNKRGAKKSK